MKNKHSILVVDDEPGVRNMLLRYLGNEGFDVTAVSNGDAMRGHVSRHCVDLVLLDLILPGEDGLDLARYLRSNHPQTGIIMVTSKNEEVDKIVGLELGADDFVTKPFSLRELLARMKALLRRSSLATQAPQDAGSSCFMFDCWTLDVVKQSLLDANNNPVRLTASEFNLLRAFVENPNQVLSREKILHLTRGYNTDPLDRVVDVQIKRLRQKIEKAPQFPELIKTVRGAGYILTAPVTRTE